MSERALPPVTALGMASLALILAGGIYLAAHLPQQVPLAPAVALLIASALVLAINLLLLARVRDFPWRTFFMVGKWALLAYVIATRAFPGRAVVLTAGLIEYAFLRDGLSGGPLVVLTLSIVVYAVHVPVLIAFTVARYA